VSLRTPLGRAKGLGSAKEGTGHWLAERVTGAALVPLVIWFVIGLIANAGAGYEEAREWVGHPVNAVLLVLLLVTMFHHAQLGMQVVYEDYTTPEWVKISCILLTKLAAYALAAAASFAVLKIAFGG
jgi:succinate dehydrogenase / fumarate reductase membrane anchor subunit